MGECPVFGIVTMDGEGEELFSGQRCILHTWLWLIGFGIPQQLDIVNLTCSQILYDIKS